jgi:hypothetical protein
MLHILSANQRRFLFIAYYVSFAALIALKFGLGKSITYYRIMTAGVATQAAVTGTTCSDRKTFSYRFSAGDKTYEGSGQEGFGVPSCAALKQGDQVPVSYLGDDPRTNVSGDPQSRFIDCVALAAMSALFIPIILLFAVFLIARLVLKKKG